VTTSRVRTRIILAAVAFARAAGRTFRSADTGLAKSIAAGFYFDGFAANLETRARRCAGRTTAAGTITHANTGATGKWRTRASAGPIVAVSRTLTGATGMRYTRSRAACFLAVTVKTIVAAATSQAKIAWALVIADVAVTEDMVASAV
jgi:hypothetical protein